MQVPSPVSTPLIWERVLRLQVPSPDTQNSNLIGWVGFIRVGGYTYAHIVVYNP